MRIYMIEKLIEYSTELKLVVYKENEKLKPDFKINGILEFTEREITQLRNIIADAAKRKINEKNESFSWGASKDSSKYITLLYHIRRQKLKKK